MQKTVLLMALVGAGDRECSGRGGGGCGQQGDEWGGGKWASQSGGEGSRLAPGGHVTLAPAENECSVGSEEEGASLEDKGAVNEGNFVVLLV